MNIFLFHLVDFPNGAAASAHARLIVKGLRKQGENASLIIPYGQSTGSRNGNHRSRGHSDGVPYIYANGTTQRSENQVIRLFQNFKGMMGSARLLYKRRKKKRLDAVIIGTPDTIRYLPVIFTCIILRIPLYIWAVEKMSLQKDKAALKHHFRYLGHVLTERFLPRFAHGYMVISSLLEQHYRRYLPAAKILKWPILVDPDSHRDSQHIALPSRLKKRYAGQKVIVYSGSYGEKDGIGFLLDAFRLFLKRYPRAVLIMTGRGSGRNMRKVRQRISRLRLEDHVEMVGFLTRQELYRFYQAAHLLLVCRSNSAYAHHGFPWKLGEYCMMAKPVLATRVGDIELYFKDGENIFITEPEDAVAIAEKLVSIFEAYDSARAVAQKGKQNAVRHFEYIKQAGRVIDFIRHTMTHS